MPQIKTLLSNTIVGIFISTIVVWLLIVRFLEAGIGGATNFIDFLTPMNITYTLYVSTLFLTAWIFKGVNNKTLVALWGIATVINHIIYYWILDVFLINSKNIYVLNFVGTLSFFPMVLITFYRQKIAFLILKSSSSLNLLKEFSSAILKRIKPTLFDYHLRVVVAIYFSLELFFSLAMTSFALFNDIAPNESLYQASMKLYNYDPYGSFLDPMQILT